jgi:hypothetical protein
MSAYRILGPGAERRRPHGRWLGQQLLYRGQRHDHGFVQARTRRRRAAARAHEAYVIEGSLEDHERKCGPGHSSGVPPAISTRRSHPTARCCWAFSSSPIVSLTAKNFSLRQGSDRNLFITRQGLCCHCAGPPSRRRQSRSYSIKVPT